MKLTTQNIFRSTLPLAISLTILAAIGFFGKLAHADDLSDATYLRKLSFHLRGYQPLPPEYAALSASADHKIFLDAKIKEYLASEDHSERMLFRLSNMFSFKSPATRDSQIEQRKKTYGYGYLPVYQDAASDLFRRMGKENLSWDQLLVGKSYMIFKPTNFTYTGQTGSDFNFLAAVRPDLETYADDGSYDSSSDSKVSPLEGKRFSISFEPNDSRFAGVLTTNRFGGRYRNSALNKNRRRASAVFRIFLCDSMSQGFVQEIDKKEAHLDSVFETDGSLSEDQLKENLKNSSAEAQHGKNQSCVGCHYKLDPMGKTFQAMTDVLDDSPAPGALSYKRKNGQAVHVPVSGIGQLGQAITQQPEYVNCQVDWFWKEFIGANIPLTDDRRAELAQSFDGVGRRTNDFISILLKSVEFRQRPKSSEFISFVRVQPLLKRCDSCHESDPSASAPSFATMPYLDGPVDETVSWLKAMQKRINLPTDSKDHMPRHSEEWSAADIQLLKTWLATGAHDNIGTAHLPQIWNLKNDGAML